MASKKIRRIPLVITCACIAICICVNTYAASFPINMIMPIPIEHISDEVFDGYEGMETTISGKVGFNYDLVTPDKDKVILIGFNPYMAKDSYVNSIYKIGTGWQIKLPYLDIYNKLLLQADGYRYIFTQNQEEYSVNYPGASSLTKNADGYSFEKADGSKEYFSNDGKVVKIIDAFGKKTEYEYLAGSLAKILYPDSTFIEFERNDLTVTLKYHDNTDTSVVATLNLVSDFDGIFLLNTIEYANGNLEFNYSKAEEGLRISLYSIENEHRKLINYDKDTGNIQSVETTYDDGETAIKRYYYNAQGRICRIVDEGFAEVQYQYTLEADGSMTTKTTKVCQGTTSVDTKTMNRYGQLTQYVQNDTILKLEYNQFNTVKLEQENDLMIHYSYTPQGQVSFASFSDGNIIAYDYYPGGQLQKVTSNNQETYYTLHGDVEKIVVADQTVFDMTQPEAFATSDQMSIGPNISVLYNINSYVGVTNFHTYYNLQQNGFNCYSYAIGKYDKIYNPGNFSGRGIDINSFSGIKYNVEQDMKSLGRSIYDCSVNASIPAHSWEIALRINPGKDYHFMQKSRDMSWGFKAGKSGPVMEVLDGRNPNAITWDTYYKPLFSSKYQVDNTAYYTSSIAYMLIRS